jgi:Arc/MetJ family transcription regulator
MQEGMLAGVPGDDDIITTAARLPKLKEKLQASRVSDLRGTLGERISSEHLRANEDGLRLADVDVI